MSSAPFTKSLGLSSLGFGFGSLNDFLRAARILGDIGVTPYSGRLPLYLKHRSSLQGKRRAKGLGKRMPS